MKYFLVPVLFNLTVLSSCHAAQQPRCESLEEDVSVRVFSDRITLSGFYYVDTGKPYFGASTSIYNTYGKDDFICNQPPYDGYHLGFKESFYNSEFYRGEWSGLKSVEKVDNKSFQYEIRKKNLESSEAEIFFGLYVSGKEYLLVESSSLDDLMNVQKKIKSGRYKGDELTKDEIKRRIIELRE